MFENNIVSPDEREEMYQELSPVHSSCAFIRLGVNAEESQKIVKLALLSQHHSRLLPFRVTGRCTLRRASAPSSVRTSSDDVIMTRQTRSDSNAFLRCY